MEPFIIYIAGQGFMHGIVQAQKLSYLVVIRKMMAQISSVWQYRLGKWKVDYSKRMSCATLNDCETSASYQDETLEKRRSPQVSKLVSFSVATLVLEDILYIPSTEVCSLAFSLKRDDRLGRSNRL